MTQTADPSAKGIKTLDKDLRRIGLLEHALAYTARPLVSLGLALVFMVLAGLAAMALLGGQPGALVVIAATMIGAYMSMNIGASRLLGMAMQIGFVPRRASLPPKGATVLAERPESAVIRPIMPASTAISG